MYKNPESLTLASPLSRSYWRTALQELRNLRMLTLAAVVVALRVVLSGLYIPLGDNIHIFFSFFINGLGSAIYGPVMGLLSGFAADILGYVIHPTGPFFFGYVLSTMMGSFFYGFFLYRARFTAWRVLGAKLAVNLLVNVGMGSLWSAILYGKGYYYYLAKGLEFDQVFTVWDKKKENPLLGQAKYICATRALHELYMFEEDSSF